MSLSSSCTGAAGPRDQQALHCGRTEDDLPSLVPHDLGPRRRGRPRPHWYRQTLDLYWKEVVAEKLPQFHGVQLDLSSELHIMTLRMLFNTGAAAYPARPAWMSRRSSAETHQGPAEVQPLGGPPPPEARADPGTAPQTPIPLISLGTHMSPAGQCGRPDNLQRTESPRPPRPRTDEGHGNP